jgi:hypothetical protein
MHGHEYTKASDTTGSMGKMGGDMNGPSTTSTTPMPGTPMSSDSASATSSGSGK